MKKKVFGDWAMEIHVEQCEDIGGRRVTITTSDGSIDLLLRLSSSEMIIVPMTGEFVVGSSHDSAKPSVKITRKKIP